MKWLQKMSVSTIITVTIIPLIAYLLVDYFNIPTALGMDVSRINVDFLGNMVNAAIAIFVFASGYYLIDQWNVQKQKNQETIAKFLLASIYGECMTYVKMLDFRDTVEKLVELTDFDKRYNALDDPSPGMRYAQMPFLSESSLLSYFQEGILEKEYFATYQNIKQTFKNYVFARVTFFDAPEKYGPIRTEIIQLLEQQLSLFNS